ncbi:plasmid partitioning protein RepBe [Fulvimarina pelagi HTCC2506]|uniref:Plasmid partitioning protein RepBe n=1 Tax=Fulvimarina pelagi HTCC2506 TaxID=314231 RepID=Q0FXN7_9HYPH|nr:plasmid partitioning protein RepB [Fulvimarina pelagi]EAU39846.1 plasmid partitioning protein RepBe [Fulvimarina pelagi HTCC2506]
MSKASERAARMKAMFSEAPSPAAPDLQEKPQTAPRNASAGAVRSLESSLSRIEEENEALRRHIAENAHVVELDTASIEASFVQDRLLPVDGDVGFAELVLSIRESGQQVPILVRAHPEKPERYQIAYGHRRWKACAELGQPVKAIVTELDDEQMVVALGKENTERKDLTFIEQALFAQLLKARKYKRETIAAALSIPPTNVSKLTTLASSIPREIVEAIGPAPKIGRPRWEALAKIVDASGKKAALRAMTSLIESSDWIDMASDRRFAIYMKNFATTPRKPAASIFSGKGVTVSSRGEGREVSFKVDDPGETGLAAYLREELPRLVEAYLDRDV